MILYGEMCSIPDGGFYVWAVCSTGGSLRGLPALCSPFHRQTHSLCDSPHKIVFILEVLSDKK